MINIEIPPYDGKLTSGDSVATPRKPGIYALYAEDDTLLYIGKAANLLQRLRQHCMGNDIGLCNVYHNITYFCYWVIDSPVDREIYETWMINNWKPAWNYDKVFTYKTDRYNPKWRIPEELAEEEEEKRIRFEELTQKIRAIR